jgi:non-canonical (house-cleaning) NTP pyrophosphatase
VQIGDGVCGADTLRRLQSIFDLAWLQVEQKGGRTTFPEASRYMLAQLVLAYSRDYRHVEEIAQEVADALEASLVEPPTPELNREETT